MRLSPLDPVSIGVLADLPLEPEFLHAVRAFAKNLVRSRNEWDIARRRSGLFGSRLLRKQDADRALSLALKFELAKLAGAGAE